MKHDRMTFILTCCLEAEMLESSTISEPMADAIILDGSAEVQMLNPGASSTFQEYGDGVFTPYMCDHSDPGGTPTAHQAYLLSS